MRLEFDRGGEERKELLEIYKIAVEEYRFQVRLNWDRARYYFAFSAALLGAAVGLLRLDYDPLTRSMVGLLFLVGVVVCAAGRTGIAKGREYYRRADAHVKNLEEQLQLHQLKRGLKTTQGMEQRAGSQLSGSAVVPSHKGRRWTITQSQRSLLLVLMVVDSVGALGTIASVLVAEQARSMRSTALNAESPAPRTEDGSGGHDPTP